MKKFTHKFRNFDPHASSLSPKLGLRDKRLKLVPLPVEFERFSSMVFDASRVIADEAHCADIDGMSIKDWQDTTIAIFDQGHHFRDDLKAETRITWVEAPSYKSSKPNFAEHDFVWTVDVFSKVVIDALPANRVHFWIAKACLGPLALSLLIIVDMALSAMKISDGDLSNRLYLQADDFASRLKIIPLFAPQLPEDLSMIGANARHAADRYLATFTRTLYKKKNEEAPFKSKRAASIALTPIVLLEAKSIDKKYSGDFERTVYNWIRDKKKK